MAATTSTSRRPFRTFRRNHGPSNGHQDSSETHVGIPFHGSCSNCHHFHTNRPFTFSLDSTVHTRLFCEKCNHPMFGLGRASTQNTLASVESGSTFTPRACADRLGQQQQEPALQAEMVPGTSGLRPLTTISERRSPAPSRSTSNIRTPAQTLSATPSAGEEEGDSHERGDPVESHALPEITTQENPGGQALRPQSVTLRRRLRTIGHRFKKRFSAKPKDWRLPRIGLQIKQVPGSGTTSHPSASASTTEVSSGQEQSNDAEQPVNGAGDETEDRHAALRARRRELTLAREREFALSPECECGPECPCNSGSRVAQVDVLDNIHSPGYLFSRDPSSTDSSNSQPSQNAAQGLDLFQIGGHFDSPRRSSSADESSSAADSGPRRVRLSQGSTLWSNGSSISVRARRPLVGRASSMPVGTRAQYLAGIRTGSQTTTLATGSGWLETAGASASLDGGSIPRRTSHTESSRSHEVSSHESSISLANLPGPQEEEEMVDGVSPTTHTPMLDGDQVTPTPHSGIRLNGGSDGAPPVGSDRLSSALHDLANRDITDHEAHPTDSMTNGHDD